MNDNLAAMVTEDENVNEEVEIPQDQTETEGNEPSQTQSEESLPQDEETFDVTITALFPWFIKNKDNFGDNVAYVKAQIKKVDPEEDLIVTVPHPEGIEYDGEPSRKIRLIEKANKVPVLDLPGMTMDIFNLNIFRIIYQTPVEDIFIKYYGVSARNVIFCKSVDNLLIPYSMNKLKKNDKGLNLIQYDGDIQEKLNSPVPMEDLIIRYKQIEKYNEGIETIRQAMTFFNEKSSTVIDVNHLLEIDRAMISLLS